MSFASQVRATTEHANAQNPGYLSRLSWFVSLWQKGNQNAYGRKVTKMLMAER